MKSYVSYSEDQTRKIAKTFSGTLKPGDVVCLYGDLGYGKTTFVKGIALAFGITSRIISPTFVLIRKHGIKNHELRIMNLFHIDLYRIENKKQLIELGIKEILDDENSIKLIEWPEQAFDFLPAKRWDIEFELGTRENKREITIAKHE